MGSCVEPASTSVKKEKTGASGRWQIKMVRPFASFLTVMRFSKDATSFAAASADNRRRNAAALSARCVIRASSGWTYVFGRISRAEVRKYVEKRQLVKS